MTVTPEPLVQQAAVAQPDALQVVQVGVDTPNGIEIDDDPDITADISPSDDVHAAASAPQEASTVEIRDDVSPAVTIEAPVSEQLQATPPKSVAHDVSIDEKPKQPAEEISLPVAVSIPPVPQDAEVSEAPDLVVLKEPEATSEARVEPPASEEPLEAASAIANYQNDITDPIAVIPPVSEENAAIALVDIGQEDPQDTPSVLEAPLNDTPDIIDIPTQPTEDTVNEATSEELVQPPSAKVPVLEAALIDLHDEQDSGVGEVVAESILAEAVPAQEVKEAKVDEAPETVTESEPVIEKGSIEVPTESAPVQEVEAAQTDKLAETTIQSESVLKEPIAEIPVEETQSEPSTFLTTALDPIEVQESPAESLDTSNQALFTPSTEPVTEVLVDPTNKELSVDEIAPAQITQEPGTDENVSAPLPNDNPVPLDAEEKQATDEATLVPVEPANTEAVLHALESLELVEPVEPISTDALVAAPESEEPVSTEEAPITHRDEPTTTSVPEDQTTTLLANTPISPEVAETENVAVSQLEDVIVSDPAVLPQEQVPAEDAGIVEAQSPPTEIPSSSPAETSPAPTKEVINIIGNVTVPIAVSHDVEDEGVAVKEPSDAGISTGLGTLPDFPLDFEGAHNDLLEIDDSDVDSAIGDLSTQNQSTVDEFIEENGRTYHKHHEGQYYLPNDDAERNRLDLQHKLFLMSFKNELHLSHTGPLSNVLDIGTGTGIWATDFAQRNPSTKVTGVDLTAIRPENSPPNCSFAVQDVEDTWNFPNKFDLIHGRALATCFKSPQKVIQSAYDSLVPGGWLEFQDFYLPMQAIDDSYTGTSVQRYSSLFVECMTRIGRDMDYSKHYPQMFKEAGFTEVKELHFAWPINQWAKGQEYKKIGKVCTKNMTDGVEGFALALFTRVGGMSKEEVLTLLEGVKKDISDTKIHAYMPILVCMGRKPLETATV